MSVTYEATGKVHELFDEQQVTDKFKKREFVLEIMDGQYPQFIKFECVQDKCAILNNIHRNDEITVSFNLSGKPFQNREGKTMYFSNLRAWKIQSSGSSSANVPNYDDVPPPPEPTAGEDDLPF